MIDFAPPLILSKPAIVRVATADLLRYGGPALSMPFLPGFRHFGAAAPEPFDITFIGEIADTGTNTAYTFTARPLGAAVTGANVRYTIVTPGSPSGGGQTVSSVTVGGLSASQVVVSGVGTTDVSIWICDTSSLGTTADVVVTWSASLGGMAMGVYRMVNPGSPTPTATTVLDTNASGVSTITITIPAGGKAIAAIQCADTVLAAITWTGTATPTKTVNDIEADAGDAQSGALSTATGASRTFIGTSTRTAPANQRSVAAAWAP